MNVDVTRLPESRVALKIELTPDEVSQAFDRAYKQLVQRVTIPGFRKGKAPRPIVERMVGHEYFVHEATDEAVRWGYRKAIDQQNLTPIDEAQISDEENDHHHIELGESFQFELTVAVKPEVPLPDYRSIQLEREEVEVTDEEVDALLDEIRRRNATLEPINRPAEVGDILTMNVTARVDGDEVINEENDVIEVRDEEADGPDLKFPGLPTELVGAARGDIREATLHLPDTYRDENLAGKIMSVRALIKEIKHAVLPEIDDDLAQSVSQFQTLDELTEALRSNLDMEKRLEAEQKLVNDAVEAVTSRTFVEIPPVLIEEEIDRMTSEMRDTLERSQLSWDVYLEATGKSDADARQEMREGATENVKTSLVLSAVADAENIQITNREVDAAIEELLRGMQTTDTERRRIRSSTGVRSNIRSRIRRQRAIQSLVSAMTGGEEVSEEATGALADQTAATAEDSEETVAVEVGG